MGIRKKKNPLKIFPGSCLSMWRKKEDLLNLDQFQMHIFTSTWGFAFGSACIYVCCSNWQSHEKQQQAKRLVCFMQKVENQAWQPVGYGQPWALFVGCKGWTRIHQDGLVAWDLNQSWQQSCLFHCLSPAFWWKKEQLLPKIYLGLVCKANCSLRKAAIHSAAWYLCEDHVLISFPDACGAVKLAAHKGRNFQADSCQGSLFNTPQGLLGQVALATTKSSILSEALDKTCFSRDEFRMPRMAQCWLWGRKISFS